MKAHYCITNLLVLLAYIGIGFLGGAAMGLFVGSQEVMAFPEGTSTKQKVTKEKKDSDLY